MFAFGILSGFLELKEPTNNEYLEKYNKINEAISVVDSFNIKSNQGENSSLIYITEDLLNQKFLNLSNS